MEKTPDWSDVQRILAFFLVGSFVAIIVILVFHPLANDNPSSSMVNTLVGVLGTMATGVATYYFGSSKGSTDKDNARDSTLNKLVNKVVTNGVELPSPESKS